jgi:hypothetical protein
LTPPSIQLSQRSIDHYNFVFALELVQVCHHRKTSVLVPKLDFAKAFDTVSWADLLEILQA